MKDSKERLFMKVRIFSQWMEEVYIPVRVRQFTKAAKLSGYGAFAKYAARGVVVDLPRRGKRSAECKAVASWLNSRDTENVARNVA